MRTMLLAIVASFAIASPVHAVPLTWIFSGTTLPNSVWINLNDEVEDISGRRFKLLIFLDTGLPADEVSPTETQFAPTRRPQIEVAGIAEPLLLIPLPTVEYLHTEAGVGFIDLLFLEDFGEKQGVTFNPPIQTDPHHLRKIPATPTSPSENPEFDQELEFFGPIVHVFGKVTVFSAVVPEGGSTALYLVSALVALGFLHRRHKRSPS